LQLVMDKFRVQAYKMQQSKIGMQREYETLIEEERAITAHVLSDNTALQSHIVNIGNMVRQAFDAQSDMETDILVESLCVENQGLREMLDIANGPDLLQEEKTEGVIQTNNIVGMSESYNIIASNDEGTLGS